MSLQDGTVVQDMRGARGRRRRAKTRGGLRAVEAWPAYADYQTKTDRRIPVFVLEPVA